MKSLQHYYGDLVRIFFMCAAFLMLVTLPFIRDIIPVSLSLAIGTIVIFCIIAGVLNPVQNSTIILDTVVSLVAAVVFEYNAVTISLPFLTIHHVVFFFLNQILAILFLASTYFSVKTLRSIFLEKKNAV